MQVIQHNLMSMFTQRELKTITGQKTKATEKLSSGYKINRAADDAAGLAISEKMRWNIRGLDRASQNAADGISLIQTAEGALDEVHSILQRMRELSVQAANDTNTATDRQNLQEELDNLTSEVNRISSTTQFNTMNLLDGSLREENASGSSPYLASYQFGNREVTFSLIGAGGVKVDQVTSTTGIGTTSDSGSSLAAFAVDAASTAVAKLYGAYPDLFSTAATNGVQVGLKLDTIDGPNQVLAQAVFSGGSWYSGSASGSEIDYTMWIDTSDYNPAIFDTYDAAKKADLAATIAHEMTHLVMYDTLTNGMIQDTYPGWFIEGSAQTSSGDNGWVSYLLSPSSSDGDIASYMGNGSYREYGAGYLATMYLGHLAGGSGAVDSASLKSGLNTLFRDLAGGKTLNEVISEKTPYAGVADFEDHVFQSTDAQALSFIHELLAARGANGAGSLLAPSLSTSEADAFSSMTGGGTNYKIDKTHTAVKNEFGLAIDYTYGGLGQDESGTVPGKGGLHLQIGALEGQAVTIHIDPMNAAALGVNGLQLDSFAHAGNAIEKVDRAIDQVSRQRANLGAYQNRLEHTIANLDNTSENTQAAESRIRDTDMAKEMVEFSRSNILSQAAQSFLTQTNQQPQGILSLLS